MHACTHRYTTSCNLDLHSCNASVTHANTLAFSQCMGRGIRKDSLNACVHVNLPGEDSLNASVCVHVLRKFNITMSPLDKVYFLVLAQTFTMQTLEIYTRMLYIYMHMHAICTL